MKTQRRGILKAVSLVGSAVLALSLAACSGGASDTAEPNEAPEETGETPVITLQTWGDTKYADQQAEIYNQEFPDRPIDVQTVSSGQIDSESLEKFRMSLASGENIPDILQINYSSLPEFAEAGVLEDITQYVEPYLDGLTTAGNTLMQYDGTYLAFPYEVKTKLWFYRADMFEEAGIDVESVKTQEDFVAAGEQLRKTFPDSYMWNIGPNVEFYDLAMIVSGNGATFSTKDPCEIVVGTDPGTAEGFRALFDLRESGVVEPTIDDWTPEWQAALADGTIASSLQASWFPTFLEEYAPDLAGKWKVTTWPVIGGADGGSESAGSLFVIPTGAKNKEAAAEFLQGTLLDPKGVQAWAEARGGTYLPAVESVLTSDFMRSNEYFGASLTEAFLESGETFKIFPYDPDAMKEQAVLRDQLITYLADGNSDPSVALERAQSELAGQLGCPWDN